MKIVIVGAGEVGRYLGLTLSNSNHHVTVIESSGETAGELEEQQDVRVVEGNGASAVVLRNAGATDCDFFLAMTSDDRTNILASSLAKALGAKTTIARVHDQTYADNSLINYQLHFGIDLLINPEALGAVELAKAIRNPGRVAVENFARGEIEVQQMEVGTRSRYAGKSLREIRLESGTRIGLVRRGSEETVPTADTLLNAGDLVTLVGPPEPLFEARRRFEPETKAEGIQRVVLFGGSETAIALIRLLKNPRFKVRLIEANPELCIQLAEEFSHITVINGSATSLRVLEEEQVGSADYFVACTKDDEDNIMTCLQARKLGVKHVQLIFNKPDYENILTQLKETLGFELAVSPRRATVREIVRYLSTNKHQNLADLPGCDAKIIEVRVAPTSEAINKPLRELQLPAGAVIVALLHKFHVTVPGAEDRILPGDRLVVIANENVLGKLLDLLT